MGKLALSYLIAAVMAYCGFGQQWKHERIMTDVADAATRIPSRKLVNSSGEFAYTLARLGSNFIHAYRGHTDLSILYFGQNSYGAVDALNDRGQAAWHARELNSFHVMVDGHDYFHDVYGNDNSLNRTTQVGEGLGSDGLPLWYSKLDGQAYHVYKGTTEISPSGGAYSVTLYGTSKNGHSIWDGWTPDPNNPGNDVQNLYVDGVSLSAQVLPSTRDSGKAFFNANGDVLWSGRVTQTAAPNLFLNTTNLTAAMTDIYGAHALVINTRGDYAWLKESVQNITVSHLIYNGIDLIEQIYGADDRTATATSVVFLNESGHIFWSGRSRQNPNRGYFLDGKNISQSVIANPTNRGMVGIDENSNCVWYGAGVETNNRRTVFVNDFNLSRDALGDSYLDSIASDVGPNGEILWFSENGDGTATLWLSTPVPEPSSFLLLLGGGAAVWRRGRRVADMP